jgi:methyl-accepting chemotaxis protein
MQLAERIKNQSDSATTLASEVYQNASTISNALEKFDQLVSEGKDKLKQADSLKSLTEINIKDGKDKLRLAQEKLQSLNKNLDELKRLSSKSNSVLTDANKVSDWV